MGFSQCCFPGEILIADKVTYATLRWRCRLKPKTMKQVGTFFQPIYRGKDMDLLIYILNFVFRMGRALFQVIHSTTRVVDRANVGFCRFREICPPQVDGGLSGNHALPGGSRPAEGDGLKVKCGIEFTDPHGRKKKRGIFHGDGQGAVVFNRKLQMIYDLMSHSLL